MTRHNPHWNPRQHLEPAHTQVQRLRRPNPRRGHTSQRLLAGAAALALAATGALAIAPGTAYADAHRDGQWYLDDFNIDKIHELSQGEGVTIGVIDSGIDPNHPDLKGNIEAGKTYGTATNQGLTDTKEHGTGATSVMAGHGHGTNNQDGILGIAPKAQVISVGIDWKSANDPVGDWVLDAIDWLTKKDVNIIVIGIASAATPTSDAIEKANNNGIAVVAPAGNKDYELPWGDIAQHSKTLWPANAKGTIPVTGTNQNHKFWNDGLTLNAAATQPQLGLSAPATDLPVAQPGGGYTTRTGTSGSAPVVAGTLALIKSAYPKLEYTRMVDRLLETVDDKGEKGFDNKYGWGIVNPHKALTEETTYTGLNDEKQVSSPDDRLPLEEQGDPVDNHPPGTNPESTVTPGPEDEAAEEAPAPPAWLTITIITAGALLTAALIALVIVKTRRGKKNHTPQTTGPPPPGHPGGPTPPTGPPPNFHGNPATQQPPGSTPPPQHNPGQTPPPPNAYGAPSAPPAPGALPPQAPPPQPDQPHSPQAASPQPGQPDSAPPPTGDAPWQPPHDPNTNPPNQPPQ